MPKDLLAVRGEMVDAGSPEDVSKLRRCRTRDTKNRSDGISHALFHADYLTLDWTIRSRVVFLLSQRGAYTHMFGGAARGAAESTRRFVLEYVREWQPADERSAARVSEALDRLSASINSHDVTLLEKPGGWCSLLSALAPAPPWPCLLCLLSACGAYLGGVPAPLAGFASRVAPPAMVADPVVVAVTTQASARSATWRARFCGASSWRATSRSTWATCSTTSARASRPCATPTTTRASAC